METNSDQTPMEQVAELVARGFTPSGAATQLGVAPRTARRWALEPEFKSKIASIREENWQATRDIYATLKRKGAAVLGKILDGGDDELKLQAVKLINAETSEAKGNANSRVDDDILSIREIFADKLRYPNIAREMQDEVEAIEDKFMGQTGE